MRDASSQVVAVLVVALVGFSLVTPALAAVSGDGRAAESTADPTGIERPTGQAVLSGDEPATRSQPAFQSAVDPDVVLLRADVRADGTAEWTVEFRVRLDDENETAAFESVQSDVEADPSSFTSQFATGMERTVSSAENRTGREMASENVTVTATKEQLPREYGVLTYRFTWTNFAGVDGNRLRVGDSLSGFFLDSQSSLVLAWPSGYETQSVTPGPDERGNHSVTWRGSADFGPNEPRVVVSPAGIGLPTALLAGVAVLVVALVAAGLLYRSRTGEGATGSGESTAADDAAAGAAASDAAADDGDDEPRVRLDRRQDQPGGRQPPRRGRRGDVPHRPRERRRPSRKERPINVPTVQDSPSRFRF
ncbi:hypothetical protein BRD06_01810 [Halobacteriales archaeon QS_9_67_15]|nr:MAG: hypothetical protein BRD06_01810 [Halobacteriales archaeon QS_9_67_15]